MDPRGADPITKMSDTIISNLVAIWKGILDE